MQGKDRRPDAPGLRLLDEAQHITQGEFSLPHRTARYILGRLLVYQSTEVSDVA